MSGFCRKLVEIAPGRLIAVLITLCSVLLSFKYFPGVESSSYYAGLILKAIHPEYLKNDSAHNLAFSLTKTPYQLSAYYLLPKIFGEIWLDDRFVAPFYVAMVAACFYFVDRIAVALGARGLWERSAIILMFMKDHQVLANKVIFAHDPDFHHSALSLPFSLMVLSLAIGGAGVWTVLAAIVVLAGVSTQVTPFTAAVALGAVAIGAGPGPRRRIALVLLAAGMVAGIVLMSFILAPPAVDRGELWAFLAGPWFKNMANPFNTVRDGVVLSVIWNGMFLLLVAAARFWPGEDTPPMRRVRMIATASFGLWLAAGLYVSFAPESLHFPQVLLFPYARQLQGPQVVLYVGVMVLVFRWLGQSPGLGRAIAAMAAIAALFLFGPGSLAMWGGLLLVAVLVVLAVARVRFALSPGLVATGHAREAVAACLGVVVVIACGVAVWEKAPNWAHLVRTGIYGGSSQVKWMETARYLRANSPLDAVVLPLEVDPTGSLSARRELASRSGRAVSAPFLLAHGLKSSEFKEADRQSDAIADFGLAWVKKNAAGAAEALSRIRPAPDYIVVPNRYAETASELGISFAAEAVTGNFTILRRTDGLGTAIREGGR